MESLSIVCYYRLVFGVEFIIILEELQQGCIGFTGASIRMTHDRSYVRVVLLLPEAFISII
jgi:hypothetical protein